MRYVCGFLFNIVQQQVALIRKNRPAWQEGRLNGIGGKIEPGESPLAAMIREFEEETGAYLTLWREFCTLRGSVNTRLDDVNPWQIHFFHSYTTENLSSLLMQTTDEQLVIRSIDIFAGLHVTSNTLPNLSWLIPMALNMQRDRAQHFSIEEGY